MAKLVNKLTDKTIKNAKASDKPRKLGDGNSLYIVIPPTGSKWWRFDFRFEGKQQTISLGAYGTEADGGVTLAAARDAAENARRLVREGSKPSGTRNADKVDAPTAESGPRPFGTVADEWLKTRRPAAAEGLDEKEARRRFKTYDRDARMVEYLKDGKETAPGFGALAFDKITLSNLSPLLKVCNHPTRIRLVSTVRKLIPYAKVHGDWPNDRPSPFVDMDFGAGFAKHKEKHRPAITDPDKFGHLLRKMEAYEGRGDNLTGYALELLALTFVRPGTIAAAKWAHVDLSKAFWVVPFETLKMATEREEAGKSADDYIIPLSRQAVALLRELRKITGNGEYLFPGRGSRTISENTINYALHGLGYKGIHCAHGFRSSASTMLNRERINGRRRFERELIEMQQDRLDSSTRAVYDRDDRLPERIELMQFWADRVDEMRGLNVVAMRVA